VREETLPDSKRPESPTELVQEMIRPGEEQQRRERRNRRALYRDLQRIYTTWLLAEVDHLVARAIDRACRDRRIPDGENSHRTIMLVNLVLNPPPPSASQYSLALRGAALKRIPAGELAARMAKKGEGIAALATFFSKNQPTKPRRPQRRSDASVDVSAGSAGDNQAGSGVANSDEPRPGNADDAESSDTNGKSPSLITQAIELPSLQWEPVRWRCGGTQRRGQLSTCSSPRSTTAAARCSWRGRSTIVLEPQPGSDEAERGQ
jgi:hypothetical protein